MEARGAVTRHYASGDDLEQRIVGSVCAARGCWRGEDSMSPRDLAALDLIPRGRVGGQRGACSFVLAIGSMHVLDVGSGLRGPSRFLAATYELPRNRNRRYRKLLPDCLAVGGTYGKLEHLVDYRHGDALHLPFEDQTFDATAWTQHASMNIAEKAEFYAEIASVVKVGGRFAVHDVVQSTGGPILFPVPWARSASLAPPAHFSRRRGKP